MATLEQFPIEPKFTIKSVCDQTGIQPVTLRAWERRHEVLSPYRSENHYRLYSERDVAVLRWIKNRVDSGVSISNAVNELRAIQKSGIWPEAIPNAPEIRRSPHNLPPEQYAARLFQALICHNEAQAGDLMREANSIFDLMTICMDIITPALVDIGEAWYRGEIRVTTEHFASAFMRGKLLSLMQAYPSRRSAPYLLAGCAPTEQHEIGSLMVAVLLRSNGYRVEYLGPDIPLADLVDYSSYEHPAMIILSATQEAAALELSGLQEQLKRQKPAPLFGFGGRIFNHKPEVKKRVPGIYLGETLRQSVESVRALVPLNGKTHPGI